MFYVYTLKFLSYFTCFSLNFPHSHKFELIDFPEGGAFDPQFLWHVRVFELYFWAQGGDLTAKYWKI